MQLLLPDPLLALPAQVLRSCVFRPQRGGRPIRGILCLDMRNQCPRVLHQHGPFLLRQLAAAAGAVLRGAERALRRTSWRSM